MSALEHGAVNIAFRRAHARLLRALATGRITNFQYEDRYDQIASEHGEDAASFEIRMAAWFLYSDLSEHTLTGKHRLTRSQRRIVARWILFLYSNSAYAREEDVRLLSWSGALAILYLIAVVVSLLAIGQVIPIWLALSPVVLWVTMRITGGGVHRMRLFKRIEHAASYWPFATWSDFARARRTRLFFSGSAATTRF